ncbi:MAG: hypothetical protein IT580_17890, partial [Verrucomicrobiales bacterium]|nr:hypothetical protein [Verrucomicrobiales bacterium]
VATRATSTGRGVRIPGGRTLLVLTALSASLPAVAQNQSLAFTGGVLVNTRMSFSNLGLHAAATDPGPATGTAAVRRYDDGFVNTEANADPAGTTANWGYNSAAQLRGSDVVMSSRAAVEARGSGDVAGFFEPSAHLEYRGSIGEWGRSTWGITLGIGYQSLAGSTDTSFITESRVTEDRFALPAGLDPALIPAPPCAGTEGGTGVRLGTTPARTIRVEPGSRLFTGHWEMETQLIPVTGGVYLETQLAGRLNGIFSAGLLAAFVNADLKFHETSSIQGMPTVTTTGGDGSNDFIIGGFAQVGLDWALWDRASLVASTRWQPTETFRHSVSGREAELDFTAAFAVHAGFALRF